jgi:signal transduction histidine kinase
VRVTRRLVAFVVVLWVVALAALIPSLMRSPDWIGALLGGGLLTVLSLWSVPESVRGQGRWSAGVFFELAFAFAVGPLAVVAMALGHGLGDHLRRRPGLIRTAFNTANHLIFNVAAWATFTWLSGPNPSMPRALLAGVAGGLVALAVGTGLLGAVLGVETHDFRPRELLPALTSLLPWNIAFGFAAGGVSVLHRVGGVLGLLVLLVPIVMLQMSLVATSRRMQAEAEKDAAHAREREALLRREAQALRRAGDASEIERKRIAADLHDSVIQDVSGLLFRSSALLGRLSDGDQAVWSRDAAEGFLHYTHDLAAEAVRELRTLMVELAPPLLDQEGLSSALRQLLTRLDREQISWVLECEEKSLEPRHQRLVYRVVQEALRNVVQHSQCRSVWVTVSAEPDRLVATIRDDGRGFSAAERSQSRKRGHAGLGLLVQTARDGGGELTITSARGRGTTLELVVGLVPSLAPDEGEVDASIPTPTFEVNEVPEALSGRPAHVRSVVSRGGPAQGGKPRGPAPATSTSIP